MQTTSIATNVCFLIFQRLDTKALLEPLHVICWRVHVTRIYLYIKLLSIYLTSSSLSNYSTISSSEALGFYFVHTWEPCNVLLSCPALPPVAPVPPALCCCPAARCLLPAASCVLWAVSCVGRKVRWYFEFQPKFCIFHPFSWVNFHGIFRNLLPVYCPMSYSLSGNID